MAGEWIKLDSSTPDKPEVFKIARIIGLDPDAVVGKLIRLWGWIDSVSVDGVVDAVVSTDVDRVCRCTGFANACERVGWLVIDDKTERITLPNFDHHNGETAKKRALKNRRQAKWRKGLDIHASTHADTTPSTTTSTREEKRREEEKQDQKKEPRAHTSAHASPPKQPDDVPESTWLDWLNLRKAKRAPVTETVVRGARREAQKAGMSLSDFLAEWCERGSQGLKADWIKNSEMRDGKRNSGVVAQGTADLKQWLDTKRGDAGVRVGTNDGPLRLAVDETPRDVSVCR